MFLDIKSMAYCTPLLGTEFPQLLDKRNVYQYYIHNVYNFYIFIICNFFDFTCLKILGQNPISKNLFYYKYKTY